MIRLWGLLFAALGINILVGFQVPPNSKKMYIAQGVFAIACEVAAVYLII